MKKILSLIALMGITMSMGSKASAHTTMAEPERKPDAPTKKFKDEMKQQKLDLSHGLREWETNSRTPVFAATRKAAEKKAKSRGLELVN